MEIRTSERKRAKMKLALIGNAGSGKTYSSLLIAYGMCKNWSKITVIDTENNSADLYSDLGEYNVLSLNAPFTPERYIEAIDLCEKSGSEVVIIDTISNAWKYILELHSNLKGNNGFVKWNQVKPMHEKFVQRILSSPMHFICNIRAKEGYAIQVKEGKHIVEKLGLTGITNPQIQYEFTTVLTLDSNHNALASKDRTSLYTKDKSPFKITIETGEKLINWCNQGTSIHEVKELVMKANDLDMLRKIHADYPEFRNELKELIIKRKEILQKTVEAVV